MIFTQPLNHHHDHIILNYEITHAITYPVIIKKPNSQVSFTIKEVFMGLSKESGQNLK